jgi:hypothetical protein
MHRTVYDFCGGENRLLKNRSMMYSPWHTKLMCIRTTGYKNHPRYTTGGFKFLIYTTALIIHTVTHKYINRYKGARLLVLMYSTSLKKREKLNNPLLTSPHTSILPVT